MKYIIDSNFEIELKTAELKRNIVLLLRMCSGNFLKNCILAVIEVKEVLLKPWCKTYYLCKFANNKNGSGNFLKTVYHERIPE